MFAPVAGCEIAPRSYSLSSGIQNSKAQSATSASRSTTRLAFPSRLSCELGQTSRPCVSGGPRHTANGSSQRGRPQKDGLGGAIGSGILSLEPAYALKYIVLFLVVVIVGGEGSFGGSFAAAMALGIIDTLGKYFVAAAAPYLLYAAVFALLLWRPQGLLPPKSAA